jgi:hypothetical protein
MPYDPGLGQGHAAKKDMSMLIVQFNLIYNPEARCQGHLLIERLILLKIRVFNRIMFCSVL